MELFRILATFTEPPTDRTPDLTGLVGLSPVPTLAAYTDVFVLQQTPHASVYLSEDGMLGGDPADRIAGFWRALGLPPPPAADHLATMLGLYATLCEHAEADREPGQREARTRARHAFLWEHLLTWLPAYLYALIRHAPEPYPSWARLLLDALLEEARALGGPVVLPLHLREVAGMADPRTEGSDAFVDALLSPLRSGMIVTHADLARAAGSLDTGLRAGTRRVVLRSLLEQDAVAVLGWVRDQARDWRTFHQSLTDPLGPLALFWTARASATAELAEALARDAAH